MPDPSGPIAHEILVGRAVDDMHERAVGALKDQTSILQESLGRSFEWMLRRAYLDGLHDGFVQGVVASAKPATSHTETATDA